jgi:5-methylcytosine-specific restriction endonuclease McrA
MSYYSPVYRGYVTEWPEPRRYPKLCPACRRPFYVRGGGRRYQGEFQRVYCHTCKRLALRVLQANALARRRGAEGRFTVEEWVELCLKYDWCCAMCGHRAKLTVDHIIPISRGGSNWAWNVRPACQSCNSRKKDKIL